jgi:hypothetical protein
MTEESVTVRPHVTRRAALHINLLPQKTPIAIAVTITINGR